MDKYEFVKVIGAGSFGVARLMRIKATKELVAMKFIERGQKISENVVREIINHRALTHPNIVRFKEVVLTPTHLAIVMEYAAGGELTDRIVTAGRFSEDETRYFFQQLISGVSYCHSMQICHRDLKLANALLDGNPVPNLKICDFGFSKSSLLHSKPISTVGTPAYIAPEVLDRKEYDGKLADVWSCGVTLYVMLFGAYPFNDQEEPMNFRKSIKLIMGAQYEIPDSVDISQDCRHLLSRIFVAAPSRRITIEEIKNHPWFLNNLPWELSEAAQVAYYRDENSAFSPQSLDIIMEIVREAQEPAINSTPVSSMIGNFGWPEEELDDDSEENVEFEVVEEEDYDERSAEELDDDLEEYAEIEVEEEEYDERSAEDNLKENVELEVEKEDEYDKQVKEVYEDKQVKEVYEDKQIKEAYKFKSYRYKMIKLLYKTCLFLTYKFLQNPWYQ